jgi:putative hydrolase of HD superfamily
MAGGVVTDAAADRYDGEPVQDQLEAYNRGDMQAFLSCYTPDAVLTDATGAVRMHGHEQMQERYARRFASPGLHATIAQRLVACDWTVDHELLTGFDGGDAEALVAFRTAPDNRIDRVVFLSSGPRRAAPRR